MSVITTKSGQATAQRAASGKIAIRELKRSTTSAVESPRASEGCCYGCCCHVHPHERRPAVK
jgi:hypothetical protein